MFTPKIDCILCIVVFFKSQNYLVRSRSQYSRIITAGQNELENTVHLRREDNSTHWQHCFNSSLRVGSWSERAAGMHWRGDWGGPEEVEKMEKVEEMKEVNIMKGIEWKCKNAELKSTFSRWTSAWLFRPPLLHIREGWASISRAERFRPQSRSNR